jgi:hypothetical protein
MWIFFWSIILFYGNQQGRPLPLFFIYLNKNMCSLQGRRPKREKGKITGDYSEEIWFCPPNCGLALKVTTCSSLTKEPPQLAKDRDASTKIISLWWHQNDQQHKYLLGDHWIELQPCIENHRLEIETQIPLNPQVQQASLQK